MNKDLLLEKKNVYGKERIYPADNESGLLIKLTAGKTFLPEHLAVLKELGYTIKLKVPQL